MPEIKAVISGVCAGASGPVGGVLTDPVDVSARWMLAEGHQAPTEPSMTCAADIERMR